MTETHYEPISEIHPHFETEILTPQPHEVYTPSHEVEVHTQIKTETHYEPYTEIRPHFETQPHEVHTPHYADLPVIFFGGSRRVVTPQDLDNQRKLADRDEFEIISAANLIEGSP